MHGTSMDLLGARVVLVLPLLLLLLLFENWNVTGWIPLWYLNFLEADQYIDIVWTISLSLSDLLKMFACVICRSSHVLPCRPSGITLDIKKSSHKKLSKWLQSKSSAGLVNVIYLVFLIGNNNGKYVISFFVLSGFFYSLWLGSGINNGT